MSRDESIMFSSVSTMYLFTQIETRLSCNKCFYLPSDVNGATGSKRLVTRSRKSHVWGVIFVKRVLVMDGGNSDLSEFGCLSLNLP